MIFVRKVKESDISKELQISWNETKNSKVSFSGIGLCMINKQLRRVCQTPAGYRLVDHGHVVKNLRQSEIRPPTEDLINIPTQTIPVVLADIETLTGRILFLNLF